MKFILIIIGLSFGANAGIDHLANWNLWKKDRLNKLKKSDAPFLALSSHIYVERGSQFFLTSGTENREWKKGLSKDSQVQVFYSKEGKLEVKVNGKPVNEVKKLSKGYKISEEESIRVHDLADGSLRALYFNKNLKFYSKFKDFKYFDFNKDLIVSAKFTKNKNPEKLKFRTYQDKVDEAYLVGEVEFEVNEKKYKLPAYTWQTPDEALTYIELVFGDKTSGKTSYGGGRFLDIEEKNALMGKPFKLDFNRTENFFCAFNPGWNCPLGLRKNLDFEVNAGERI